MRINAVVFDLDDTLYPEKDYALSGFQAVDRWVRDTYQISGFYEAALNVFHSGEKKAVFNRALDMLAIPYNEKLIQDMVALYRSHQPQIRLYEDAEWTLNHLSASVKIGLISDGYLTAQAEKVKALQLERRFHCVILTDAWGREHWKPSPVPYEHLSKVLQIPGHECVYIGDNVSKDFVTANRLGWTTVHIEREEGIYSGIQEDPEYQAHHKISSLRKLKDIPVLHGVFDISAEKAVPECKR